MRKKIRHYLWSLIVILTMTSTALAEVDSISIEGTTSAQNGQNVDIFVNATNAINIGSLQLDILFDKDILIANEATIGNIAIGSTFVPNIDNNNGIVSIGLINVDGFSGTGSVAKINFTVNGVEGDTSLLDISLVEITDPDGVATTVGNIVNNTFTVTGPAQVPGVDLVVDNTALTTETNVNATYTLTVTNTGNAADTFELSTQNLNDATVSLEPTGVALDAGQSQNVVLNVSSAIAGVFIVNVTATSETDITVNDIISTTTTVVEPSVPGVDLTVDVDELQTETNVNATYLINVSNTGNVEDTFDLVIQNPQNAIVSLNMILGQTSITLSPGTFATGLLNVTSVATGTFIVNLTATSQADPNINDIITTTTTVVEPNVQGVDLIVDNPEKQANVGVNATYILTLTNTGNNPDTFDLIIQNPQVATASLDITSVALDAGQNQIVNLNVSNTITGNFIVNVTATSQADPSINDTITTNTTVVEPNAPGVDLIVDQPEKQTAISINATYVLTVTNTGNNDDTFDLTIQNLQNAIASIDIPDITLVPGESQNINLNVTSTTAGNFIVNVTATSQADPSINDTITTNTTVQEISTLDTITITPISTSLTVGESQIFIATAKGQNGEVMAGINITWTSDDPNVGDLNPRNSITGADGNATTTFTASGVGIAAINATNGTVTGTASASVSLPSTVNIAGFGFGSGNGIGNRGKFINASINITNSGTQSQTFVIVVSGVTSDGFPLVGTGTLTIQAGETINNIPVILTVPPTATLGTYSLFAGVWTIGTFPTSAQLASSGPIIATVN